MNKENQWREELDQLRDNVLNPVIYGSHSKSRGFEEDHPDFRVDGFRYEQIVRDVKDGTIKTPQYFEWEDSCYRIEYDRGSELNPDGQGAGYSVLKLPRGVFESRQTGPESGGNSSGSGMTSAAFILSFLAVGICLGAGYFLLQSFSSLNAKVDQRISNQQEWEKMVSKIDPRKIESEISLNVSQQILESISIEDVERQIVDSQKGSFFDKVDSKAIGKEIIDQTSKQMLESINPDDMERRVVSVVAETL